MNLRSQISNLKALVTAVFKKTDVTIIVMVFLAMNLGNLHDYFIILNVFLLMFNNKRWCNTFLYSTNAFFSLLKINLSNSGAILLVVSKNVKNI